MRATSLFKISLTDDARLFFEPGPGAGSSVNSSSSKPRRTVLGSIPNNPDTYSIPPCPSLTASIPA